MMLDEQVRDVRDLTRKAGIKPTTTRVQLGHPLLIELAPGERSYAGGLVREEAPAGCPLRWRLARSLGASVALRRLRAARSRCRSGGRGAGVRRRTRPGSGQGRGGSGRGDAAGSTSGQRRGGSGAPRRSGGTSTVYSTSTGGGSAAAFSAGIPAGHAARSR